MVYFLVRSRRSGSSEDSASVDVPVSSPMVNRCQGTDLHYANSNPIKFLLVQVEMGRSGTLGLSLGYDSRTQNVAWK